ncbi:MAG: VOC family protein [Pseudomonadota bacterium]
MRQQIAIITLGIKEIDRSKKFYSEGFGWSPIHKGNTTVMYKMNGFILSTWLLDELDTDMKRINKTKHASFSLAFAVQEEAHVALFMERLVSAGGSLLRNADSPEHGGLRGYVADPDGHAWEILFHNEWKFNPKGYVYHTCLSDQDQN